MKRIILFLIFLMSLTDVSAQMQKQVWTKSSFEQNESTVVYIPWRLTNDGCFGCASFWWLVNQTYIPSQGQYRYDIWFSSNSYYANGVLASTYVQGLYFNIDGYNLYQEPSWLLFKEKFNSTLTSFYSSNPTPVVHMTWSSMKVY